MGQGRRKERVVLLNFLLPFPEDLLLCWEGEVGRWEQAVQACWGARKQKRIIKGE